MFGELSFTARIIITAVFLAAFIISSVTDIKHGKIPIYIFPSAAVISLIVRVIDGSINPFMTILCGFICFVIFVLFALFGKGGGGDAIMMGCYAAIFYATDVLLTIVISSVLYVVCGISLLVIKKVPFRKMMKSQFPYAPFAAIGFVVTQTINILRCF